MDEVYLHLLVPSALRKCPKVYLFPRFAVPACTIPHASL